MKGAQEYVALLDALDEHTPACHGDPRFIDDTANTAARAELAQICRACPVRTPCRAYAVTARPTGGYWPGMTWNRKNG